MAKQLNVFAENRPGRLESVAKIFAEQNINIRTMTIQDRGDFGLLKILVDKPNEAYLALANEGFACALKDILAIALEDKPGSFYKLTTVLLKHNINIQDAYGFVVDSKKEAVLCVEVKEPEVIKSTLKKEGFKILEDSQLYEL
ncbi:MAG: ACT domain-containing protein [Candidatus Omnitrophica bacterium]|nr:ACT domain-containing protein [Candidatus Omnitrophota bacterium]